MIGAFPVRLSHLLRHCTVGALVRGSEDDQIVVVKDTTTWYPGGPPETSEIRYVERVRKALELRSRLCTPPTGTIGEDGELTEGFWIPAVRFPSWTSCTRCRFLHRRPWAGKQPDEPQICQHEGCRGRLEQVPWVLVHEEGYLADVPWHQVAHFTDAPEQQGRCAHDNEDSYLRIEDRPPRRWVRCTRCESRNELPTRLPYPSREWQQPWVPTPPTETPEEPAWLVEINDVRVHASVTSTAIVIPPESRIQKGTPVDLLYTKSSMRDEIRNARSSLQQRQTRLRAARRLGCTVPEIEAALLEIERGYPHYDVDSEGDDLVMAEYRALAEPIDDLQEDEDFVTRHNTARWKALRNRLAGRSSEVAAVVARLVEVRRLKEIVVLRGFTRLGGERIVSPDITEETGWLPAIALRGEGIFFSLDQSMLERWGSQLGLQPRAERLDTRLSTHPLRKSLGVEEVSPRFVLLHTLAHLVIRQLAPEAGYPTASLKERIFCSTGSDPMAGILIYVAVPDDIGSLGGLVELAEPTRFLRILSAALESATWCSLDPICSEHDGQGPELLNGAACQGCSLVPDPTCQYGNVLLDRSFIKGNAGESIEPLLQFARGRT